MERDTYVAAVLDAIGQHGDQPMLTFLADGTGDGVTWTFMDLHREAGRVARLLRDSVEQGDRVLLMMAPGPDYVAGFFGCLYAGAIAVPAYPPSPLNGRQGVERIEAIIRDADVAAILVSDATGSALAPPGALGPVRWLTMDEARAVASDDLVTVAGGDDIAFLQYTSGSTGDPKGVMVTQRNLVANIAMMTHSYQLRPGQTVVSWLPPYHDMGLIGVLLTPALVGQRAVVMPPSAFLRQPVRWLQAISRFGGYISTSPNFGYESCLRKVRDADLEGVDLSSWRVAINGAEPVRASTVEGFAQRFGAWGFRREAMYPAYGLAEVTLMTATASLGHGSSVMEVDATALMNGSLRAAAESGESRLLVTCGNPPPGAEITVVDPETRAPLEADRIGELVVRGPHVARGYWKRDDETLSDGEFHTGDLGCFVDGEMIVTGRVKDLIVIRGRNHYPHDVERTAEQAHPGFRPGCGAAFTVDAVGEERLVVVQEATPAQIDEPAAAVEAIRRSVTSAHGVAPYAVVLSPPGAVSKTSSGKIRRRDTRRRYESDQLPTLFTWTSDTNRGSRTPRR